MSPSRTAFIVFSDDWGEHPSSCQHLFRYISVDYPVLWVNTIGMRLPTLSWGDVKKIYKKASRMLFGGRSSGQRSNTTMRVQVCQPLMLPFINFRAVRRLNKWLVARKVKRLASQLGIHEPVIVSTVPNACDYIADLTPRRVVYYCVDDFSQWPGLEHALVAELERQLIVQSDVLLATSQTLYRKLAPCNKEVHLFTHGVDIENFSREAGEHECLQSIPVPRVGYFGLFDERSDQDLIAQVARAMPDVAFVITGPIAVSIEKLAPLPNIYFTGPVPYEDLSSVIRGLKALLIPYKLNAFTETISPLKLKEYLVTGRPVVSTPLGEARILSEWVTLAATADEWVRAIRQAFDIAIGERKSLVLQAMRGEAWNKKAEQFVAFCLGKAAGGLVVGGAR